MVKAIKNSIAVLRPGHFQYICGWTQVTWCRLDNNLCVCVSCCSGLLRPRHQHLLLPQRQFQELVEGPHQSVLRAETTGGLQTPRLPVNKNTNASSELSFVSLWSALSTSVLACRVITQRNKELCINPEATWLKDKMEKVRISHRERQKTLRQRLHAGGFFSRLGERSCVDECTFGSWRTKKKPQTL